MSKFKEGDRVTVAGLPGEVSFVNGDGSLDIDFDGGEHVAYYIPASIVEKIVEPVKVGDVIEGADAFAALPVGAVVRDPSHYRNSLHFRTADGWAGDDGDSHDASDLTSPRTLVYLPTP